MNKPAVLGMNCGVDSFVAAMLLLEQGYDIIGVTFLFAGENQNAEDAAFTAKKLAASIGKKHVVVDLRKEFDSVVVSYFKNTYLAGQTPFPCAVSNPQLKFSKL